MTRDTQAMPAVGRRRHGVVERMPVLVDAHPRTDATVFAHSRRSLPPVPPARPRPSTSPRP